MKNCMKEMQIWCVVWPTNEMQPGKTKQVVTQTTWQVGNMNEDLQKLPKGTKKVPKKFFCRFLPRFPMRYCKNAHKINKVVQCVSVDECTRVERRRSASPSFTRTYERTLRNASPDFNRLILTCPDGRTSLNVSAPLLILKLKSLP